VASVTFSKCREEGNEERNMCSQPNFFRNIVQKSQNPIVILDGEGRVRFLNNKAEQLLGWSVKDLFDQPCPFIPTSSKQFNGSFLKNIKKVQSIENEKITIETKNEARLIVTYSAFVISDAEKSIDRIVITFSEYEDQVTVGNKAVYRDTLKELRDLKFALNQSSIVTVTDPNGVITYVNKNFCDISLYSEEELIGKTHRIFKSGYHNSEFYKALWKTITSGQVWKGEIKNQDKIGNYYWVDTTIVPFLNDYGKPYQYVIIRNDISKRKKALEEINYLVYNDELTGLPNKRKFLNELGQQLKKIESPIAVLCIDLDRFKLLNDSMGHRFGDIFLRKVSDRLKSSLSEKSFIARQGGDEFVAFIPEATEKLARQTAQKIIQEVSAAYFIEGHHYYITCSIGISMNPIDGDEADELLKKADIAMFRVKKGGKNNYEFFDMNMDRLVKREMQLDKYLRKALQDEQFELHYQPKLDLRTGEITGMEALLRWDCPPLGMVAPLEFIPMAEETGLIIPIGEWVLREACFQNKKWQEAGFKSICVSVNLSVRQFQDPNLVLTIIRALEDAKLAPKYLELEITENIAMENKHAVNEKLERLKELGVSISMDDFGTGYSSLSYLGKYPINTLKIDKVFVDDLILSKDTSVVRAIISLAHSFNLNVIAEGVEEQEQIDCLKTYLCDEIQGYALSRPLAAKDFEENILRNKKFNLENRKDA
jgi:diguanylate cyclase (GGDEF)-like protein/PAS domain S-box-containing protein